MRKIPTVLALHDLTGVGRCSLSLITPVMSCLGVQVCPVATASLSTHPAGFGEYYMESRTHTMDKILQHYKKLGLRFQSIYTGFLGEPAQVALISDYIHSIPKAERGLVVIDPVFGDNGKLYETQQAQIVDSMRAFIRLADVITPNMTEAAYLAGEKPAEEINLETAKRQLASFGVSKAVITGVRLSEHPGKLCVCGMAGGAFHLAQTDLVPGTFHGTGDTFASVLTACLLLGKSFAFAMEAAADFVCLCCKQVTENQIPLCEGLPVEGLIPALQKSVLSIL